MQKVSISFFILLVVFCNTTLANGSGVVAQMDAFAYTQPVSYTEFISDWLPQYFGGELAFQYVNLETGMRYGRWGFSVFQKDYFELEFSKDTSDFFFLLQNKKALDKNKTYKIDLNAKHIAFRGIQGRIELLKTKSITSALSVGYLQGLNMLQGSLKGEVTPVAENDFDISNAVLDYHYSKDDLFKRKVSAPQGYGYNIDFKLDWTVYSWFDIEVNASNVFGSIYWEQVPFTRAQIETGVKEYDENGYIHVEPALQGRHGNERFVQHLPRIINVSSRVRLVKTLYALSKIEFTPLMTIYTFGVSVAPNSLISLQMTYLTNLNAGSVHIKSKWFQLGFTADNLNYKKARVLGVTATLNLLF